MPGKSEQITDLPPVAEELSKRQLRANRILDAAAELILRYGYKKTTIDDIARQAGVAKGTIYLHWKAREDLFSALLLRESVEAALEMLQLIDADPEGLFLHAITRYSILVILKRPLTKALFVRDTELLGTLVHNQQSGIGLISQQKFLVSHELFSLFREHGLLRQDQSIDTLITMYSAIIVGFMTINQFLPENLEPSSEEIARIASETIRRALEPDEPISSTALQAVRLIWDAAVEQIISLIKDQLQQTLSA